MRGSSLEAYQVKSSRTHWGYVGLVVQDAEGKFFAATRYVITTQSAAMAEALSFLRGCQMGIYLGDRLVIVESDSLESISCLRDSLEIGSWEAYPTLAKVKRLGDSFQDYRWSWIPRSANLAADLLVSTRFPEMCNVSWVDRPPSSLVNVLNNYGLLCPP
ncbi:hypothetical protein PS1_024386 [Malus domestica]